MSETIRSLSEKLMMANERCDEKDKQIKALSLSVKSLGEKLAEAKGLLDDVVVENDQLGEVRWETDEAIRKFLEASK